MENKLNIAELLKDCPKGMELDCTMFDEVTLLEVTDSRFPIKIAIGDNQYRYLTGNGGYANDMMPESKCIIFPKGKTTWEGFVPPCKFKDGDDTLSDALSTFGAEHQRIMCMEECAELIDALAKYDRGRAGAKDVITELADVNIMVEQMAIFFGKEEFEKEKERKLKRLQEKINEKS